MRFEEARINGLNLFTALCQRFAAACADGDVGLVCAGHGGVVEAVKLATL
jgi:hypothetical protein